MSNTILDTKIKADNGDKYRLNITKERQGDVVEIVCEITDRNGLHYRNLNWAHTKMEIKNKADCLERAARLYFRVKFGPRSR